MPRLKDQLGRVRKMTAEELRAAFEESHVKEPMSGCWLWTGTSTKMGYGVIAKNYAHRLSYRWHIGEPGKLHVLHRCDNPPCVNPAHLFIGTQQDNNNDKLAKGRAAGGSMKGEAHPSRKLSESDVLAIRSEYATGDKNQSRLARKYGVRQGTIWQIVNRNSWRHV